MKKFFRPLLIIISTLALFTASTSSMACYAWILREPKMPESLIRID